MTLFASKSISIKLLAISTIAITVFLALTFSLVILQIRERALSLALQQARTDAGSAASTFGSKLQLLNGATISMASSLEKQIQQGSPDRAAAITELQPLIEKFDLVFGSWLLEMPLGFDGKAMPAGDTKTGTTKDGVFAPYWVRGVNGPEYVVLDQIDYNAEDIINVVTTKAAAVTEPYIEDNAENKVMMSIYQPFIVDDKVHGFVGIDIGLNSLADSLKDEHPFGTGRVYLLSSQGKWLAAPDKSLVMKDYDVTGKDDVANALKSGETQVIEGAIGADGQPVYRVVHPFDLVGLNSRWAIVEDVPVSAISAIVNEQTRILIFGGIFIQLAVFVALALAIRTFVRNPINSLLVEVQQMSRGTYSEAIKGTDRSDEMGALATALEAFRHKLADGKQLELTNEHQRLTSEDERRKRDEEREYAAVQQQKVVVALGRGLTMLSEGDLTYRIAEQFPGSYEKLQTDYNSAIESLEQTILRLNATVSTLNAGTSEISLSSDHLSKRTEQQAASLEETAAALNEIGSQLNDSARNATDAAQKVEDACNEADESSKIVANAISAMQGIEESSNQVSQIIGVIDQIAFQTNLLALNAGVEAARAGDAGKGFAVVAQEVRELSQRSAAAAKEIKTLISKSGTQVEHGVRLVSQTGDALSRIVSQVQSINQLIKDISDSARLQASGLKEINAAVNQMDRVTQQNAAMVEETTAASNLLNDEANSLQDMVRSFKVGGQGATSRQRKAA